MGIINNFEFIFQVHALDPTEDRNYGHCYGAAPLKHVPKFRQDLRLDIVCVWVPVIRSCEAYTHVRGSNIFEKVC